MAIAQMAFWPGEIKMALEKGIFEADRKILDLHCIVPSRDLHKKVFYLHEALHSHACLPTMVCGLVLF